MHIHICARACVHACKYARAHIHMYMYVRMCGARVCMLHVGIYGYIYNQSPCLLTTYKNITQTKIKPFYCIKFVIAAV